MFIACGQLPVLSAKNRKLPENSRKTPHSTRNGRILNENITKFALKMQILKQFDNHNFWDSDTSADPIHR